MIQKKSKEEMNIMRLGGRILAGILGKIREEVKPGVSAFDLDKLARELIFKNGVKPSFLGYQPSGYGDGYPAALCVSIDDEIVHGLPEKKKIIFSGDIVKLDLGVEYKRLHTDATIMVGIGSLDPVAEKIIKVTKECLDQGIDNIRAGATLYEYGKAVETHAKRNGFTVVRDLVGHGVGHSIHEPPQILNYAEKRLKNIILEEGMTFALEPMINEGSPEIILSDDGWTYRTADGKLNGHWEHTVAVTKDGCEVLTK